jgi:hypothetical protein
MGQACGRWRGTSSPIRCVNLSSHRFPLRDVEAAVHKAVAPDSMKVAITPWA